MKTVDLGRFRRERVTDNAEITPLECLEDAASEIREMDDPPGSVMVIALKKGGGVYNTSWWAADLSSTEMIALMRKIEHDLLHEMSA